MQLNVLCIMHLRITFTRGKLSTDSDEDADPDGSSVDSGSSSKRMKLYKSGDFS